MTDDNGLRPAEQAVLEQIETRLGMTRAAIGMVGETLDQIEPEDLLRLMSTPDERQTTLIGMLQHYDEALSGLAALHMILEFMAHLAKVDAEPAEPDGEDITAMFDGFDELLGGSPPGEHRAEARHRFTVGPDGETEEQR